MAEIKGQLTLNEIIIVATDDDPSTGVGLTAPVGSFALLDVEDEADAWLKYGAGDTAWARIARQANGTVFSAGSVVFANADGLLSQNNSQFFWDNPNASLGLGITTPQAKLHIDGGNATAVYTKYTAGTTTGQSATDGFDVGVDASGNAELRQRENLDIRVFTNNSEAFRIDNAGRFILSPAGATAVDVGGGFFPSFQILGNSPVTSQMLTASYSADVNPAVQNFLKSRNATIGAHTIVQNGDEIGRIQFRASNGTAFDLAASIRAFVDGTPGASNDMPGALVFYTTPDGSATIQERLRLTNTGLGIFNRGIRIGDETDTTNATMRFSSGGELLGRVDGQWRNLATMPIVITATANTSTSAAGYSTIAGMTSTPGAGTYLVVFSCNAYFNGDNGTADITLFVNGVEDNTCFRTIGSNNTGLGGINQMRGTLSFMTTATVADGQVIDVRMRENGNDTLNISQRVFMLIPISRGA